jgi:Skp family chaperone for outer membrane proteins
MAVLFCMGVTAATAANIAVVDLEKVMKAYPETQSAEAILQSQVDEFELEQKELEQKVDRLKQSFEASLSEAENKALSESAKEKKIAIAREKAKEYELTRRDVRATLNKRKQELTERGARMSRRIVEKLKDKIQTYAKEKGFDLVLDSSALSMASSEMVLFATDKINITDAILELTANEPKDEKKTGDEG